LKFKLMLRLKRCHACDQCSRASTFLTGSHCKFRANTEGKVLFSLNGSSGPFERSLNEIVQKYDSTPYVAAILLLDAGVCWRRG
jgi:hypothetical protein